MIKRREYSLIEWMIPCQKEVNGVLIDVFISSKHIIKRKALKENNLYSDLTMRMINPKFTKLIEQQ